MQIKEIKKDFSNEELLTMIQNKDLKITLVVEVKQEGFNNSYKRTVESIEELNNDIELFKLTIVNQQYLLLSDTEIAHINKEGYIPY